jgi:polysaccharide chain length determinant protein (PEP-CTERM system associated)
VIPGKKYTPEDLVDIVKRRVWLIVLPFVVIATGTSIVAYRTPNLYKSETLILVVPQRIPESYVKSTITSRIEDRLQSISQQILSRTRLERIISEFNLYAQARRTGDMENIVERMRRDINVETVKGDAFRVSYISGDQRATATVTNRLASLFIEENLRDREVLAEGTNQFLETQLEDARQRLAEREKKVEEYRRRYSGELPSQVESNLQVIQNTQLQVQTIEQALDRDRDRRVVLERSIADSRAVHDAEPAAAEAKDGGAPGVDPLDEARADLQRLEMRLKPEHPDVVAARRKVRELESRPRVEPRPAAPPRASGTSTGETPRIRALETEMQNLDRQIATKEQEARRLRGVVSTYQARVESAPTRESELTELTRDYTTLQQVYANLLAKGEDSKVAANLERSQNHEQFRVLDPARPPERPFSPDRVRLNIMGAIAGLAVGFGIAALVEYRDTSMRTDEDVITALALPVLAMIPAMTTLVEIRRQRIRRLTISLTAAAGLVAVAVVLALKKFHG